MSGTVTKSVGCSTPADDERTISQRTSQGMRRTGRFAFVAGERATVIPHAGQQDVVFWRVERLDGECRSKYCLPLLFCLDAPIQPLPFLPLQSRPVLFAHPG
jgi:hypothetical protein